MTTPHYADESVTLWHGDALTVLSTMPDESVNCVVTSPPYFGLRDYGVDGQMGLEGSPAEYVSALVGVFDQVRRVLAKDGTCWLNIGDSYSSKPASSRGRSSQMVTGNRRIANVQLGGQKVTTIPHKNLCLIPQRLVIALQESGWFVRQEIIWAKKSHMPERVTDRPTRAHEQIWLLSRSPRYWYDADAIREDSDPKQVEHNEKYAKVYAAQADRAATTGQPGNVNSAGIHARPGKPGRNADSVWSLSTTPFPDAHYATMPVTLAVRCVIAGCKPGGVVLDPFSGSGTTGLAAARSGRRYVGIDLNAASLDLSLRTRLAQGVLL